MINIVYYIIKYSIYIVPVLLIEHNINILIDNYIIPDMYIHISYYVFLLMSYVYLTK